MKTRVFNLLVALAGIAAAFGYKLDLTPEQLTAIAGALVALVSAVNQVVHEVQAPPKDAAP